MEALLYEAGYKIIYNEIPWKRALSEMKTGELDAMANLSITNDRKEFIHFVGPQMDETMSLFYNSDKELQITSLDDIKSIPGKIGIQIGVSYGETFNHKLKTDIDFRNKFIQITDGVLYGELFQKKRITGFILNRYVFYYRQNKDSDYIGLIENDYTINESNIFFGFSKNNFSKDDIEELNKAYERVVKRSGFKAIIEKYRITDSN